MRFPASRTRNSFARSCARRTGRSLSTPWQASASRSSRRVFNRVYRKGRSPFSTTASAAASTVERPAPGIVSRDALVQIANELAARTSFAHPLVPAVHADSDGLCSRLHFSRQPSCQGDARIGVRRASKHRDRRRGQRGTGGSRKMDSESPSFARDLLRETLPDGVRLVVLCRSHRQDLLEPPPHTLRLELKTFTAAETAAHLRQNFSGCDRPGREGISPSEFAQSTYPVAGAVPATVAARDAS